jgi:hypothetical protein
MNNHVQKTSHELRVRMEMTDDGKVYFDIAPDNYTFSRLKMTPNELAANNVPISALAIRILFHMCCFFTCAAMKP